VTGAREFDIDLPPTLDADAWIGVRGGGLSQPIQVKVTHVGLAARIVALRIDSGLEVTSSDLRTIRLGDLAAQLSALLRRIDRSREAVPGLTRSIHGVPGEPLPPGGASEAALQRWKIEYLGRWSDESAGPPAAVETDLSRGRGAKPAAETELRLFAQVYLGEAADGRGAVTRTARRIGVDRSTAHRWIKLCRERGLLPTREDRS
jgi:hypothetical protein